VSVLPVTIGCGGSTDCPSGGVSAARPNSAGFAALCGIAAATASAPAIFAVAASVIAAEPPLRVGPLTVALADDLAAAVVERVLVVRGAFDCGDGLEGLRAGMVSTPR
jgi:hypothetical protein